MKDTVSYREVRHKIADGDVALFRNGGLIARLSESDYTHAATCFWIRDKQGRPLVLMLAEVREGRGGQVLTLSSQVKRYQGVIDIFRPTASAVVRDKAVDFAVRMAGHPYGWRSIAIGIAKRLTLWRLLTGQRFRTAGRELSPWGESKHCSQAVCWSERAAARSLGVNWEPTEKNDRDTEPGDLDNLQHFLVFKGLVHESNPTVRDSLFYRSWRLLCGWNPAVQPVQPRSSPGLV